MLICNFIYTCLKVCVCVFCCCIDNLLERHYRHRITTSSSQ
ncbi:hypothetical protein MtrunA17_Chr1g0198571 [Medicago truncatula]|uniref:Uncharacterized protein n=1 Tax=Medicago truncatula TaxID=3880 RepID=A0A396JSU6_MEDTR|nr:hypothetical protein MtrunA17_Chr1g0198571 [Medicago truncatula]